MRHDPLGFRDQGRMTVRFRVIWSSFLKTFKSGISGVADTAPQLRDMQAQFAHYVSYSLISYLYNMCNPLYNPLHGA